MNSLKRILVLLMAALVCSALSISVFASSDSDHGSVSVLISTDKESVLYAQDAEGNQLGISDYWIDEGKTYLLSDIYNRIYVYDNNKKIEEIDLNRYGTTTILFAVDGNHEWIYDNRGRLVFLEDWEEKGYISIYSFAESEAIIGFSTIDGELYVTIISFSKREDITYRITWAENQLICSERIPGRKIREGNIEDVNEVKALLNGVASRQAQNDGYLFTAQQGVMDIGFGRDGYRYILSREILDDGVQEYYLQRVYRFTKEDVLIDCFNIPDMIPACNEPVKMIDGIVYLLDTEDNYVRLDAIEKSLQYDIKDCLMPFNWSRVNNVEANTVKTDTPPDTPLTSPSSVTRFSCISRFDSYCTPFTWACAAANLAPLTGWQCPHYVSGAGSYNSMPYCWSGFCDWNAFNTGILSGYRVGNVNIGTTVEQTVGTDCSGAASRALALSYHCTTSGFTSITNLSSWSNMRMADLILNPGSHVIMYYYTTTYGYYCAYECTILNNVDRCITWFRTPSALSAYSVYTYPGFSD